jgi:hypothetical protein
LSLGRRLQRSFVLQATLIETRIRLLPASAKETAPFVEALRAEVVGLRPQPDPSVTQLARLGEQGVDDPSADALAPQTRRDVDHRYVAEPGHGEPAPSSVTPCIPSAMPTTPSAASATSKNASDADRYARTRASFSGGIGRPPLRWVLAACHTPTAGSTSPGPPLLTTTSALPTLSSLFIPVACVFWSRVSAGTDCKQHKRSRARSRTFCETAVAPGVVIRASLRQRSIRAVLRGRGDDVLGIAVDHAGVFPQLFPARAFV